MRFTFYCLPFIVSASLYLLEHTVVSGYTVVLLERLECEKSGRSRQDGTVNRNGTVSADWLAERACFRQVCELSGSRTF